MNTKFISCNTKLIVFNAKLIILNWFTALFERLGEPIVLNLEEGEPVPYRPHRFPPEHEKSDSVLEGVLEGARFCRPEP